MLIPTKDLQTSMISQKSISPNEIATPESTFNTLSQDENIKELVPLAYDLLTG